MKGGSPNEVLKKLRTWLLDSSEVSTMRAQELLEELDNWLTGGGPLPDDWARIREMMRK